MCVTSMIGDHYGQKWPQQYPSQPWTPPVSPFYPQPTEDSKVRISRELDEMHKVQKDREFQELKKDVQEMKELLKKAKAYDIDNGEPECELEEKYELIRKVAKYVEVEIEDVIGAGKMKAGDPLGQR